MEKRKAYIITALIILLLLTGLAFWYLYIAKQDLKIGQITDLELYGTNNDAERLVGSGANNNTGNPFSTVKETNTSQQESLNEIIIPVDNAPTETPESWRLVQIHPDTVVGASIINTNIQFTDQKTGYIYKSNKEALSEKISNITVAGVTNAYNMKDSRILFMRENAPLTRISLNNKDEDIKIEEVRLIDSALMAVQSGDYLYYTSKNQSKGIDIRSTKDNTKILWSSPLLGWSLQAVKDHLIVTQYASRDIPGYAYMLPKQGVAHNTGLTPIAQDLPGLITNVSPDAQQLLYSTSGNKGTVLYLKKIAEGDVIPLSIKTLASKCSWGSDNKTLYCAVPNKIPGTLPDTWYKGQVHFTDNLWRINTQTGDAYELAHQTGLDIIEIVEDTENGLVIFKNKTDQSLWAVIKN